MEEEVDITPVINQEIKIEETQTPTTPTQIKNENLKENNKMEISPIKIPKLNGDSINKFPQQFNEEEFSCSSSETGGLIIDQDAGNSNQQNDIEEINTTTNLNNNLKRKSEDDENENSSQQHQTNNNNFVRHKKMLFTTYPEPPDLIPPVDLFNDVLPTTSNTNSLYDSCKVTPTHSEMHEFLKRQQELTRMNDMGKIFGKNSFFFKTGTIFI